MLTKKKKLSKKEIKEDKLVSLYYKTYGFFEENKSRVLMYGGAVIVVILIAFFYINNQNQKNTAAGEQLGRVMNLFDQGAYKEAIDGRQGTNIVGLKKIVEDYGSTENGETAKIYLADAYNMLGNEEEAYKYYSDYDGSIDMYKATAFAGQAGYYAGKKEYEKAADFYLKAAHVSETNAQNPDYLLDASINYIKAGNKEEAKNLLTSIKKDYTTSPVSREVDRYLAETD